MQRMRATASNSAITTPAPPRSPPTGATPPDDRSATSPRRCPAGGCPVSTGGRPVGLRQPWPILHAAGHGWRRHIPFEKRRQARPAARGPALFRPPSARRLYDAGNCPRPSRPACRLAGRQVAGPRLAATILERALGWLAGRRPGRGADLRKEALERIPLSSATRMVSTGSPISRRETGGLSAPRRRRSRSRTARRLALRRGQRTHPANWRPRQGFDRTVVACFSHLFWA